MSRLKMNVRSYVTTFLMKLKIVHTRMREIFRLKQQAKFKTIDKNICIILFAFKKLRTNITFQNVSLKGLKRKQGFET